MMVRKYLALLLASGTLVLAACNTVEGAGEDLQSASEEVREEIKD